MVRTHINQNHFQPNEIFFNMYSFISGATRNLKGKNKAPRHMMKNLTKQVVFGQGIEDPGGSYKVTHCG